MGVCFWKPNHLNCVILGWLRELWKKLSCISLWSVKTDFLWFLQSYVVPPNMWGLTQINHSICMCCAVTVTRPPFPFVSLLWVTCLSHLCASITVPHFLFTFYKEFPTHQAVACIALRQRPPLKVALCRTGMVLFHWLFSGFFVCEGSLRALTRGHGIARRNKQMRNLFKIFNR